MTVKIITPEGGTPQYVFLIALRNNIIGNVTFTNKKDLEHFNEAFKPLLELGFGMLNLEIDGTPDEGENNE